MPKPKKRKHHGPIMQEWIEHGMVCRMSNDVSPEPAKYMLVCFDNESGEDYPLYAKNMSGVKSIQMDLSKRQQGLLEIVQI
jgi:hypothetical protein